MKHQTRGKSGATRVREDEKWMTRAIRLARRGMGATAPNPVVGCVIVKGGKVLGEGFHTRCGSDHAEVAAMKSVGDVLEGSTT